jgi:hypothetical protein
MGAGVYRNVVTGEQRSEDTSMTPKVSAGEWTLGALQTATRLRTTAASPVGAPCGPHAGEL